MKTLVFHASRTPRGGAFAQRVAPNAFAPARRQQGMAVIVVMALLSIILIYLADNIRTLYSLGQELKLVERQQTRRLQAIGPLTTAPATTNAATSVAQPRSNPNSASQ